MRNLFSLILLSFFGLYSCGGNANSDKKVLKIEDDKIVLENGKTIPLQPGLKGDKTVLFIVKCGETNAPDTTQKDNMEMPLQTLNDSGVMRSQQIAELFADLKFESVLAPMSNFATQFGTPLGDSKGKLVYNYNANDYGSFLDYIYGMKHGHKFVVVAYGHKIADMINLLSMNKQIAPIPPTVYNKLYVVITKTRGDGEVYELEY